MSKEYMQWRMQCGWIPQSADSCWQWYGKRLEKLTGHIKEVDGLKVNFGVYEVVDVNAFACGDGNVHLCRSDGHYDRRWSNGCSRTRNRTRDSYRLKRCNEECLSPFGRKNAAGAASSTVAKLSDSELGAMAEALAGAQYSETGNRSGRLWFWI